MTSHALPPVPHWHWLPLPRGAAAEPRAREWLGARLGIGADRLPLERDRRGRPQLRAGSGRFDCNWSHSGEGLLVALGEGVQVGVDLEWRRPRPRARELARRFFTAAEADWLESLPASALEPAFLRLWCAREAVLKAHGHGLSFGLHRLRFADQPGGLALVDCDPALGRPSDWGLLELEPAPGYLAALAWRATGDNRDR